jgi:hypothetical protein
MNFRNVDNDRGRRLRHRLRQDQDDQLRRRLQLVDAQTGVGLAGQRQTTTRQGWTSEARWKSYNPFFLSHH